MTEIRRFFLYLVLLFTTLTSYSQPIDTIAVKQRARELSRVGRQLGYEGKYTEALDSFKLFLNFRKKIYGERDYLLGSPYMSIGIAYNNLGQNNLALKNYKLAEENYSLDEDKKQLALGMVYHNIGNIYRAKLDYNNALNYFNQSLNNFKERSPDDLAKIAEANYSIAEINLLQNNYDVSLGIIATNYIHADTLTKIYFDDLSAINYQRKGLYKESEKHYKRAIELTKLYFGINNLDLAYAYMNYADFLSEVNKFDEALTMMDKALAIIRQYQKNIGRQLSQYFKIMGKLYESRTVIAPQISNFKRQKIDNLRMSLNYYAKGLEALGVESSDYNIDLISPETCLSIMECINLVKHIGDVNYDLAMLEKKERSNLYEDQLNLALQNYNSASSLIQTARKEISNDESKLQLAELGYSTFVKTIETAFLAYEQNKDDNYLEIAFNNSEQLKSSAVFDKISNDLAQENSIIPDSLLELESKLNNTISIYSEKLFEENNYDDSDSTLITEYDTKIFDASKQRDELNRYLEEEFADYYDLKYSNTMQSAADIQKQLHKKEALIEYVITETDSLSHLYTFLITHNKKELLQHKIDSKDLRALETVFRFMSTPNYIFTRNEDSKEFCEAANELYKLLIHPIRKELTNKNIIVIPDGQLNYIAFDGLLTSLPDTSKVVDFSKLNYLINEFNVSYANSANILIKNRNTKRTLNNNTLAFAPEYNSEKVELSNASYTLMPLPGVKKEVEEIASTVKTKIFEGDNASEENFREKSKNYDILHLAMHAYINDSLPAYSRLAFSPRDNEPNLQKDGWLNTADIYNLNLNARLTVLSACNTGVGKLQKGEGIMSLARGFLYAGCPSIIMSLWEVEDQAGTKIMTSFYKNLKRGKTKDEALRLAKISYLENSNSRLAHPHYWMSFKSIGDNSPIYTSYDIYFFGFLFLLIIAFSVDQAIRVRKARRKREAAS